MTKATRSSELVERLRERDCPKCGGKNISPDQFCVEPRNRWVIACEDCDWMTATYETQEMAWAAWNAGPEADRIADLENAYARADHFRTVYARALERMRLALVNAHDHIEDEGDRVYFGSTNHAEELREAWHLADTLRWGEILKDTQPKTDLASTNLYLQGKIAGLEARLARAEEALRLALPRLAHKHSCWSVRPTSEWAEHGSASFENCNCEIKAVRAALQENDRG